MAAPGWYPDPGGGGGERYWDGYEWKALSRGGPTRGGTVWVWIVFAAVPAVVITIVVGVLVWRSSNNTSDAERWTSFPRTVDCSIDRNASVTERELPPALVTEQVKMSHLGGDRLELEIEFATATPDSIGLSWEMLMYNDKSGDKTGVLNIQSPEYGYQWTADASEVGGKGRNPLTSVKTISRNTVAFEVNLEGLNPLLRHGSFEPTVEVWVHSGGTTPESQYPFEVCAW